jgi:hypothetical protein
VGGVVLLVEDGTAPQRVVDQQQAAGPQAGQDFLVVGAVPLFVGIDESEVEGLALR